MNDNLLYRFAATNRVSVPLFTLACLGLSPSLRADTLLSTTTFSYGGQSSQNYTVPANADYVVIKAWGPGGGGAFANATNVSGAGRQIFASGGTGGFVNCNYDVVPGLPFTIWVGGGGTGNGSGAASAAGGWPGGGTGTGGQVSSWYWASTSFYFGSWVQESAASMGSGGGGGYTRVQTPVGDVWAGGGGGAGGSAGGNGGAPYGTAGSPDNGNAVGGSGGSATSYSLPQGASGSASGSLAWYSGFVAGSYFYNAFVGPGVGGGGGGGGGYNGGGGGASVATNKYFGGGGGGSSRGTGPANSISFGVGGVGDANYPGGAVATAGSAGASGGNGAVVIMAYQRSPSGAISGVTIPPLVETYVGGYSGQYSVPVGIEHVTVKAWGAGGGSLGSQTGGAGAYVSLKQAATGGELIDIKVGTAGVNGSWSAGKSSDASRIALPGGTVLIAGAGGTAGTAGNGGAAGIGAGASASGAGGTTTGSGSSTQGVAGLGGYGGGTTHEYDAEQNEIGSEHVGDGRPGTVATSGSAYNGGALAGPPGEGGAPGNVGDDPDPEAVPKFGGYGGGGFGGGGGGGSAFGSAGGGGGGGSSGIKVGTRSSSNSSLIASSNGTDAPNSGDTNYPGGSVGATSGTGAVVIILHPISPTITSAASQTVVQYQPVTYSITLAAGANVFTTYTASSLPAGLTLNQTTGVITGRAVTPGTYPSTIRATSPSGHSEITLTWTVTMDTTPPASFGPPQASNITVNSFVLSWPATTDNSAVTAYEVRKDGISLGQTLGTSVTLNGLAPETKYVVAVKAGDAAGNWTPWTADLEVWTAIDTSNPSAPVGVHANSVTASVVALAWSASPDDVGTTGYEVRKNGVSYGTASVTTMPISGLTPGTLYTFGVKARDAKGNWSAWSDSFQVTTATAGADTLLSSATFLTADRAVQTYVVPAETNYVVIKTWGAGGGGGATTAQMGGTGGYTVATFWVNPGDTLAVSSGIGGMGRAVQGSTAGQGGWPKGTASSTGGGGGGYSGVQTPYGNVWAEGGAGGGTGGGSGGSNGMGYASGLAYNISHQSGIGAGVSDFNYPGNGVGKAGNSAGYVANGGSGAVVILAYDAPTADVTQTFLYSGSPQTYTAPVGAHHVVIKAWAAGGGSGANGSVGGTGAFVTAAYNVNSGETISISPGVGGAGNFGSGGAGGGSTKVGLPGGTTLYAGGGGGGGLAPNGNGGAGGVTSGSAPANGSAGGGGYGGSGGGGGSTTGAGSSLVGVGGAGGAGNGTWHNAQYDEEGFYTGDEDEHVGNGRNGVSGTPGAGGTRGEVGDGSYYGGGGGAGLGGGAGGGSGDNIQGGGGGGGGSSGIVVLSQAPTNVQWLAGSAGGAAGASDATAVQL